MVLTVLLADFPILLRVALGRVYRVASFAKFIVSLSSSTKSFVIFSKSSNNANAKIPANSALIILITSPDYHFRSAQGLFHLLFFPKFVSE